MIRVVTVLLHATLLFSDLAAGTKLQKLQELYGKFPRIRHEQNQRQKHQTRRSDASPFLNDKSAKFAVNGTGIPDVDFDVGESYAGLLPINNRIDEERNLFFWFFPTTHPDRHKEVVIWLNGGPGCSSLAGLLQENGPFLWQYGTFKPVASPWSWHTLTNVVWIEQPVGTGFSTGNPTATSEEDVAAQFMGFWKNFIDTFAMQGYRVYLTGESYAGMYCPYIANAMLDDNDTTYFAVGGMMLYDPLIADDILTEVIPTLQFVDYWSGLFPLNDTFRASLRARDADCGFSAFVEKHLIFPPLGPLPPRSSLPGMDARGTPRAECIDLFDDVVKGVMDINPCFNVYHVSTACPLQWDVLGFPGSFPYLAPGARLYFNRSDVKEAINAPQQTWETCRLYEPVFVNNKDSSQLPVERVLPRVIDATQNVVIAHGALDMVLYANGTLLGLQNMTWGGQLGFQTRPEQPFYVPHSVLGDTFETMAAAGVFGSYVTERGLTYIGVALSGHMVPQYAPSAAYRQLEFVLGRVNCLNCTVPFTTDGEPPPQSQQPLGTGTAPQGWSNMAVFTEMGPAQEC